MYMLFFPFLSGIFVSEQFSELSVSHDSTSCTCTKKYMEDNTVEFDVLSLVGAHQSVSATNCVVSETVHTALCNIGVQRIDPVSNYPDPDQKPIFFYIAKHPSSVTFTRYLNAALTE